MRYKKWMVYLAFGRVYYSGCLKLLCVLLSMTIRFADVGSYDGLSVFVLNLNTVSIQCRLPLGLSKFDAAMGASIS